MYEKQEKYVVFVDVSHGFIIYQEKTHTHTQLINLNTIQCYHHKKKQPTKQMETFSTHRVSWNF